MMRKFLLASCVLGASFFAQNIFAHKNPPGLPSPAHFPLAPDEMKTCFTPKEKCEDVFIAFIQSAKESIDMATYRFAFEPMAEKIIAKAKEIPIRLVVDGEKATHSNSLVAELIKGGVKVRLGQQRGHMHNKFMIVDGKMVETGSLNYSKHSFHNNQENQVFFANAQAVSNYVGYFRGLWETSQDISLADLSQSQETSSKNKKIPEKKVN